MKAEYLTVTVGKFIFRVKVGYFYTEAGVWLASNEVTGAVRAGLTDYRQQTSGDVVFVELPEPGSHIAAGDDLAAIETIKVDLALPSPLDATVAAVNPALGSTPEMINQDPYAAGWLVDLKPDTWPAPGLLDAGGYLALMTAQAQAEAAE